LKVVQAKSRFLSSAKSRYTMIELECLSATWRHKFCQFLEWLPPFKLITDHMLLIPILLTAMQQHALHKLEKPRLPRLRLKMQHHAFKTRWIPGKESQDSIWTEHLFPML
jgi:hypothetical protein